MSSDRQYSLSVYREVTPLCEKGNVVLVKNEADGNLYVKKSFQCYNPEVYVQLQNKPVKNTPDIYGIYARETAPGTYGRDFVIIEEYLPGSTLAEQFMEKSVFTEEETIDIVIQLCRILMDLHGMTPPIIHRDIKPSNIMIMPDGAVKLLDFNAAKIENREKDRDTVLLGTAGFAAPEQYGFSAATPQTDIYALGVLMNLMLTRKLPSEKIAGGKMKRAIRLCLEMNPKDRYRDVKELYDTLKYLKKVKAEWFLPGFRTLRIYKMIPAAIIYLSMTVFLLTDTKGYKNMAECRLYQVGFLASGFLLIFFYCNYMDIHRKIPLMRSKKRWLRILGYALAPFVMFWILVLFISIVELLFF